MRLNFGMIILFFLTTGFLTKDNGYRKVVNESYFEGERLDYRVHLGFLTGAHASIKISKTIYQINGRPCFKVNVFGKTAGMIDVFYKVRDNWGTYIDTTAIVPQRAYRFMKEGNYRKNEIIYFNHLKHAATVARLDDKTKKLKKRLNFTVPNNVQDIVSGYYYLRTMDFTKFKKGQIIVIDGFFDEEDYKLKLEYLGTETVDTKFGDLEAYVLAPILPKNSLFEGDTPIKMWLSKDKNKIPLKIKAQMNVGAVVMDLKNYKNLRTPLK